MAKSLLLPSFMKTYKRRGSIFFLLEKLQQPVRMRQIKKVTSEMFEFRSLFEKNATFCIQFLNIQFDVEVCRRDSFRIQSTLLN